MKIKKKFILTFVSILVIVIGGVVALNISSDKGDAEGLKVSTTKVGDVKSCSADQSTTGWTVCEGSQDSSAVAGNFTVYVKNTTGNSIYVAFGEALKNYEDAYYNFNTGKWNCASSDFTQLPYVELAPGQSGSYNIHVEGSHSTLFGEYNVQYLYLKVVEQSDSHKTITADFSYTRN